MRGFPFIICAALVCTAASSSPPLPAPSETQATPLILEKNEGERRILRGWPGHPDPTEILNLKVDPKNGGSSHLVFMTANIDPGGEIDTHKHPGADEILFLENGTARVRLGDKVREVHAGATVFIPSGTWISVSNVGKESISAIAVFSAPGFEEFIRDVSVPVGQKSTPMTEAENDAVTKKHGHTVIYQ